MSRTDFNLRQILWADFVIQFCMLAEPRHIGCAAFHNFEGFHANNQTCAVNGLAIVIDRLF
jgi:hypothetical protein